MNGIHLYAGVFLFVGLSITMILGALGLSMVEKCEMDNDCDINKNGETGFTQLQFDALWALITIIPIATFGFIIYFMMFTKYDPSTLNELKNALKGNKKNE